MPCGWPLRLDPAAALRVEARRRTVVEAAGCGPVAEQAEYPPHFTLAICPDGVPEDDLRVRVATATRERSTLLVRLVGFGLCPGESPVLWAVPVVTEAMLARHAALHAAPPSAPWHPHDRPGAWVSHVTLHQGGRVSPPERMIVWLASLWAEPIAGTGDRAELARFLPPAVRWSTALGDAAPKMP